MAISAATEEALWLKQLYEELMVNKKELSIKLYCDNRSAINLSTNHGYQSRSKYIDIQHHFIREKIKNKIIEINPISTE